MQDPLSILRLSTLDSGRGLEINPLHIDRGSLPAIFYFDDPIVSSIAADRFVSIDRLRDLQLWYFSALDQIENKRRSPDFHGRGPFAHIRVAEDDVKPAITASVNMRFVPRVDQWPEIHRVNAHQHAEKICPLRDLISPRLTRRTLRFGA